jgi:YjgF/chorismate_mutase-like, putative endoribonuclease
MSRLTAVENLQRLGIVVPEPPAAVGAYVTWVRTGNLVLTSGQLPWQNKTMLHPGRLGSEVSVEDGYLGRPSLLMADCRHSGTRAVGAARPTVAPYFASYGTNLGMHVMYWLLMSEVSRYSFTYASQAASIFPSLFGGRM